MQHEGRSHEDVEVKVIEVIETNDSGEVIAEEALIEIEDVAQHGKHGTDPRKARAYRIVIDRVEKTVHRHEMTGREILGLVDKSPDTSTLTEKLHGGRREKVEPDQVVIFHRRGVERFETAPKSATNG